jgi:hypothetical protein
LDEDEIREIFRATAVTSLGEEGMNALLDALADMESAPDLNGIMRLSVRPGVTR